MKKFTIYFSMISIFTGLNAQEVIPIDTNRWDINARSHVLENYKGQEAIYMQAGSIILKDYTFLNGTIEYDIYLKEEQSFPGVYFRATDEGDAEQFYLRPHLSGKPDANQAVPQTKGISPWQLYFGPKYSFSYEYNYDNWTHVKLVVKNDKAQVFLDYSETPHLSWNLFHEPHEGKIGLTAGNRSGMHLANIRIDKNSVELVDFNPIERQPIERLVQQWEISDMFKEEELDDPQSVGSIISKRKWGRSITVEEGTAANISRQQQLYNGDPGNSVFAKIEINSNSNQIKLFEFGYSDRVVAILNGEAIYRGNNRWRSRDYRYLGTIGLFDSIYLNLKKGKNTLLFAVSEDFGGWLITGRFEDEKGIRIVR